MAFDQLTRNHLQRFVSDTRQILETEFTRQLQNDFGLDPSSGTITPLENLRHLTDAQRETTRIIRETLAHYCSSPGTDARTGLERIVREQAFTVLNRLAALRMAEARGLLIESVGNGYQAKGFQLYGRLAGSSFGEMGDAYRSYLFSVFDELSQDLPGLFDRYSSQGRLFPREGALLDVITLICSADIDSLWAEDETIGWIYQYFNSKEERKAMREASQAPRNSRELAVRNQFFTPRYVVEFLVDNTLGRLWFNAMGGQTCLRTRCRFLVVKKEEEPKAMARLRDPRTLKFLDPACGSMHFGLYAFDLFLEIYREAWGWEQKQGPGSLDVSTQPFAGFKPLCQTYLNEAEFLLDIPHLIIEHNIYGVDIDPRAVQIASLALWLRAQRAWHEEGIKAKDRPRIGPGKVVAAIAPPTEKDLCQEIAANLDRLDGDLFVKTLEMLKDLPELGILLQIEHDLPRLIKNIYGEHGNLFRTIDVDQWKNAEKRLLSALHDFISTSKSNYRGRLFAEDAMDVIKFIDLINEKFDCIVMNPPFGEKAEGTANYIDKKYPQAKGDLGACFVIRGGNLLRPDGRNGAITNRTMLAVQVFEKWRNEITDKNALLHVVDLGHGVLDAMVETAMYVTGSLADANKLQFNETSIISLLESSCKEEDLIAAMNASNTIAWIDAAEFNHVPGAPWAYWVPSATLKRFNTEATFAGRGGLVAQGPATADDFRFYRLRWEVPSGLIHVNPHIQDKTFSYHEWSPVTKGGEYELWWSDIHLLVNWAHDGREIKAYVLSQYPYLKGNWGWVVKNTDKLFRRGTSYPYRTTSSFGRRYLPPGVSFSVGGWAVFPPEGWTDEQMLAVYNSRIARYFMEVLLGQGDSSESGTAARNHVSAAVGGIPWPVKPPANIDSKVKEMIDIVANYSLDETTLYYFGNQIFDLSLDSFENTFSSWWEQKCDNWKKMTECYLEIESEIINSYGLKEIELEQISLNEGSSLSDYPKTHIEPEILAKYFKFSLSELTDSLKTVCGSKRYIVKKAYFIDRTIDLVSHMFKVHPTTVIEAARIAGPSACGFDREFAQSLASWLIGIAFKRFDTKLSKNLEGPSAGGCIPNYDFAQNASNVSILVDDRGHKNDITAIIQNVIQSLWPKDPSLFEYQLSQKLDVTSLDGYIKPPSGFFANHLNCYSKSRRKAPIYWPLSTPSGSYTLWIYYPSINNQTLYTCINDFLDPKANQVESELSNLRAKGAARSREDENRFETLHSFELELIEFREAMLNIAPFFKPNLNDGVQINAAPLWSFFQYKPWQKVLKETWTKLEKGEYDWAHLAMTYWADRVREKCKTDMSTAIAHDLISLCVEPESEPQKSRGRKKAGGKL